MRSCGVGNVRPGLCATRVTRAPRYEGDQGAVPQGWRLEHAQSRGQQVSQAGERLRRRGPRARAQPRLKKVMDKLPEAEQEEFKAKSQGAMKFLLGKIKELQLCAPPPLRDWTAPVLSARRWCAFDIAASGV